MDIKTAKLSKAGKPLVGEPQPGKYYRVEAPGGTDIKAAALEFKKQFPKSFFAFRAGKAQSAQSQESGKK